MQHKLAAPIRTHWLLAGLMTRGGYNAVPQRHATTQPVYTRGGKSIFNRVVNNFLQLFGK